MSGFAGIVHLDGSPVDVTLLQRLTQFQKFRGPDALHTWTKRNVGFGHTLLRIDPSTEELQPLSVDGKTWIVADCRIDGRANLVDQLENKGEHDLAAATDPELILRAYHVWGENCVEHLLGDFGFAIWDDRHQHLFCARDQMGVKPFFYARVAALMIFSNTLDCIRQHPRVSDQLNDLAIADFLLFDIIREPGATSFVDIQRLPPAHTLTCGEGKISPRRYWSLPVSAPIHYKRQSEYIDHFRNLLDTAVSDRLRTDRVGVLMSGGLDSPTVAASAQRILAKQAATQALCAYTEVFDSLIPHEERYYAGLAAKALNIPIKFYLSDRPGLTEQTSQTWHSWPEPVHLPWTDTGSQQLRNISAMQRVVLTGYGGDPALACLLTRYFPQLIKEKQFGRALRDAVIYLRADGRFSRLYLRTRLRRWFSPKNGGSWYPNWLNGDFEKRLGLHDRWRTLNESPAPVRAVRPVAYEAITDPSWPMLFESCDAGTTGVPVEVRHPYFDLRVLNFLLALSALPWCSDKELLREVCRGVLPDAVRLRPKSPLITDPLVALLQRPESAWVDAFQPNRELDRYVQRKVIPNVFKESDTWRAWINLRPLSLHLWLQHNNRSGINERGMLGAAS